MHYKTQGHHANICQFLFDIQADKTCFHVFSQPTDSEMQGQMSKNKHDFVFWLTYLEDVWSVQLCCETWKVRVIRVRWLNGENNYIHETYFKLNFAASVCCQNFMFLNIFCDVIFKFVVYCSEYRIQKRIFDSRSLD